MRPGIWRSWFAQRDVKKDHAVLGEIVRRIIDATEPEQIILFGSAARKQARPHSDFDLLVVKDGAIDRTRLLQKIYAQLFGIDMPVDIVIATPEELRDARDKQWTLLGRAQSEGLRLYPRSPSRHWQPGRSPGRVPMPDGGNGHRPR